MATDSEASEGDDQASVDMSAEDGLEGDDNGMSMNKSNKAMFNMESNSAADVNKKAEDDKLRKDLIGENGKSETIKVTGHVSSGR